MAGNPYYVEPGNPNIQPALAGIGDVIKQNRDERKKQQEVDDIMAAVNTNDPDKVADLMIRYPERAKDIQSGFNMKKGVTEPIVMNAYQKAIADPANAQAYLDEASDEVEALGRNPVNLRADAEMFMENPEAAMENVKVTYAGLDPEGWKAFQGQRGGAGGMASAKTEILDSGAVIQALPDGSVQVRNPAGDVVTGDARLEILKDSRILKKKTTVDTAADKQQAVGDIKVKQDEEREERKLRKQLKIRPEIETAITLARKEATDRGEVLSDLNRSRAALPGLTKVVNELKELAPIATSTFGGRAFDIAVKESGFGSTKGSTARAKFIAIVNNQVLPLLKATFGGSFSVQEGQELKASMGDPNATPEEKIAQLNAFITQKTRDIEAKELQVQQTPPQTDLTNMTIEQLMQLRQQAQ